MQEMTPPVQENFFAVGHEYWMKIVKDLPGKRVKYIAPFRLSNGKIDHIFAYEEQMGGRNFVHCISWSDASVRIFIGDEL